MRRSRLIASAAVALALAAFFLLTPREKSAEVDATMPEECVVISSHLNLPRVWKKRIDNPLLREILGAFDLSSRDIKNWKSAGTMAIVRITCGRRVVLGVLPGGELLAAGHAGYRWPILRAMLFFKYIPGVGKLATTSGGTRFMLLDDRDPESPRIAFAMKGNVLLASLGNDPELVNKLTHKHELPQKVGGSREGTLTLSKCATPPTFSGGKKGAEHSALIQYNGLRAFVEITRFDEKAIEFKIAAETNSIPFRLDTRRAADFPVLPKSPLCVAATGDSIAWLCADESRGRLLGLAVPAIIALMPKDSSVAKLITDSEVISKMRIRKQLDGETLYDWLGKVGGFGMKLGDKDCLMLAGRGGWLAIASSKGSWQAQLNAAEKNLDWKTWFEAAGKPDTYFWLDVSRTGAELRQILAVANLAIRFNLLRLTEDEQRGLSLLSFVLERLPAPLYLTLSMSK